MKKKLFLPMMALTFAAMGAFASAKMQSNLYFPAGDEFCEEDPLISAPCIVGSSVECMNGSDTYYYRPVGGDCIKLLKD